MKSEEFSFEYGKHLCKKLIGWSKKLSSINKYESLFCNKSYVIHNSLNENTDSFEKMLVSEAC